MPAMLRLLALCVAVLLQLHAGVEAAHSDPRKAGQSASVPLAASSMAPSPVPTPSVVNAQQTTVLPPSAALPLGPPTCLPVPAAPGFSASPPWFLADQPDTGKKCWDNVLGGNVDFVSLMQMDTASAAVADTATAAPTAEVDGTLVSSVRAGDSCAVEVDFSSLADFCCATPSPAPSKPGWWQHVQAAHPASGSGTCSCESKAKCRCNSNNPEKKAIAQIGQVMNNGCDQYWYNPARKDPCPNNGMCFPGVVVPALTRHGFRVVTVPMQNAIRETHSRRRDHRGQAVLDELNSWKVAPTPAVGQHRRATVSHRRRPTIHHRIPDAGNCKVCRYAYAKWNGITKSMLQGAELRARRGDSVYNPSSVLGRQGRETKPQTHTADAWIRLHLKDRMRGWNPKDSDAFVDRVVLKDLWADVYCKQYGADSAPYSTFVSHFTKIRKEYKIKWRTQKDHLLCDYCGHRKRIINEPLLTGTALQNKAVCEYNAHWELVWDEQGLYYDQVSRSRRPNSNVLSINTDKAASENTAHPNLARNQRCKSNSGSAGKFEFALQGVLQHGHSVDMYGIYPWISCTTNYWWTSVIAALQCHTSFGFEEVHLQVDGGTENWSRWSFLLGPVLLAAYPTLRLVRFSRMRVGHTKSDLDQKFSIPYEYFHGRVRAGCHGRTALGHTEWVDKLKAAFEHAAEGRAEKAAKGTKRRRSSKRKGKTVEQLEAEREVYTKMQEPMNYAPQHVNFDMKGILDPLLNKKVGGYGPIRDPVLKAAGLGGTHVMEFYRSGSAVHWHHKEYMSTPTFVECGDIYDTLLTECHSSGPLEGKSAKFVIEGLASAEVVPKVEAPKPGWFVSECTCGLNGGPCTDPKCCKCECGYSKFKAGLHKKLDACAATTQKADYVERARSDWEAHFAEWDDHEAFLHNKAPTWRLPPAPDAVAAARDKARQAADKAENMAVLAEARKACMQHECECV